MRDEGPGKDSEENPTHSIKAISEETAIDIEPEPKTSETYELNKDSLKETETAKPEDTLQNVISETKKVPKSESCEAFEIKTSEIVSHGYGNDYEKNFTSERGNITTEIAPGGTKACEILKNPNSFSNRFAIAKEENTALEEESDATVEYRHSVIHKPNLYSGALLEQLTPVGSKLFFAEQENASLVRASAIDSSKICEVIDDSNGVSNTTPKEANFLDEENRTVLEKIPTLENLVNADREEENTANWHEITGSQTVEKSEIQAVTNFNAGKRKKPMRMKEYQVAKKMKQVVQKNLRTRKTNCKRNQIPSGYLLKYWRKKGVIENEAISVSEENKTSSEKESESTEVCNDVDPVILQTNESNVIGVNESECSGVNFEGIEATIVVASGTTKKNVANLNTHEEVNENEVISISRENEASPAKESECMETCKDVKELILQTNKDCAFKKQMSACYNEDFEGAGSPTDISRRAKKILINLNRGKGVDENEGMSIRGEREVSSAKESESMDVCDDVDTPILQTNKDYAIKEERSACSDEDFEETGPPADITRRAKRNVYNLNRGREDDENNVILIREENEASPAKESESVKVCNDSDSLILQRTKNYAIEVKKLECSDEDFKETGSPADISRRTKRNITNLSRGREVGENKVRLIREGNGASPVKESESMKTCDDVDALILQRTKDYAIEVKKLECPDEDFETTGPSAAISRRAKRNITNLSSGREVDESKVILIRERNGASPAKESETMKNCDDVDALILQRTKDYAIEVKKLECSDEEFEETGPSADISRRVKRNITNLRSGREVGGNKVILIREGNGASPAKESESMKVCNDVDALILQRNKDYVIEVQEFECSDDDFEETGTSADISRCVKRNITNLSRGREVNGNKVILIRGGNEVSPAKESENMEVFNDIDALILQKNENHAIQLQESICSNDDFKGTGSTLVDVPRHATENVTNLNRDERNDERERMSIRKENDEIPAKESEEMEVCNDENAVILEANEDYVTEVQNSECSEENFGGTGPPADISRRAKHNPAILNTGKGVDENEGISSSEVNGESSVKELQKMEVCNEADGLIRKKNKAYVIETQESTCSDEDFEEIGSTPADTSRCAKRKGRKRKKRCKSKNANLDEPAYGEEPRKQSQRKSRRRKSKAFQDDKKKMTLADIIYYDLGSSAISDMPTEKESGQTQVEEVEIEDTNIHEDRNENIIAAENTVEDAQVAAGPKLIVLESGEVIVDKSSLVVSRHREKDQPSIAEVISTGATTYASFRKTSKSWSKQETALFYKALTLVGSDFALMESIVRHRSRKELKLKFKREEKRNLKLLIRAMYEPQTFDINEIENYTKEEETSRVTDSDQDLLTATEENETRDSDVTEEKNLDKEQVTENSTKNDSDASETVHPDEEQIAAASELLNGEDTEIHSENGGNASMDSQCNLAAGSVLGKEETVLAEDTLNCDIETNGEKIQNASDAKQTCVINKEVFALI